MLQPMQPTGGWSAKIAAAPRLRTIAGAPGHGAKRVDGPHRAAELATPPSTSEALQQQDLPVRSRKSPPAGEYLVSKSEARGMGFGDGRSRLLVRTGTACRLDAFRAARLADRATEDERRREFFDQCPCHLRTAHFLTEQVSPGGWTDMWAVHPCPCRCRCHPSSMARTAGALEQSAIADEMVAKSVPAAPVTEGPDSASASHWIALSTGECSSHAVGALHTRKNHGNRSSQ